MAGGIDVVNRMKYGLPVTDVIHLGAVADAGLDAIAEEAGQLRLGALVTHDRLATSPLVARHQPALALWWHDVANIRVRCKGTIGGNIMACDPAYEFALAAMAADAGLHFLAPDGGARVVAASEPGAPTSEGLLVAIALPDRARLRLSSARSLRPIVSLALGLDIADGRICGGRVAIGCAYPRPIAMKLPLDEPLMPRDVARCADRLAQATAASLPEPLGDGVAGSGYRRRMIEVLLRRELSALQ
jgi:carbon-monoxide dehydrogenase medium subunit